MIIHWLGIRIAIGTSLLAILAPRSVAAHPLPDNDLDSLVFLADEIVECQIVRGQVKWDDPPSSIRVTHILGGSLKVDQQILVPTAEFTKAGDPPTESHPFGTCISVETGDRLILFLRKASVGSQHRDLPQLYRTVGSGLKLVKDETVYGFSQESNPGAYVAATQPAPHASIGEIRDEIRRSQTRIEGWRREFTAPASKEDIPRLLSLLESRSKLQAGRDDDVIADIVAVRLAGLHDIPSLCKAMPFYSDWGILYAGFGTPEGRDFLLEKVTNPKLGVDERAQWASALGDAGCVYRSTVIPHKHSFEVRGSPDKNNSFYITRIAKLIAVGDVTDRVTENLVNSFPFFLIDTSRGEEMKADLKAARVVLEEKFEDRTLASRMHEQLHGLLRCIDRELKS